MTIERYSQLSNRHRELLVKLHQGQGVSEIEHDELWRLEDWIKKHNLRVARGAVRLELVEEPQGEAQ